MRSSFLYFFSLSYCLSLFLCYSTFISTILWYWNVLHWTFRSYIYQFFWKTRVNLFTECFDYFSISVSFTRSKTRSPSPDPSQYPLIHYNPKSIIPEMIWDIVPSIHLRPVVCCLPAPLVIENWRSYLSALFNWISKNLLKLSDWNLNQSLLQLKVNTDILLAPFTW